MCIAGCLHGSASALALCCPRAMCCAPHVAPGTPCTLGTPNLPGRLFPFPHYLLEAHRPSPVLAAIKPRCANALSLSGSDLMIIKWHI